MRKLAASVISATCLLVPAAALAGGAGSGTINYRATATFSDGSSADRLYSVNVGDLDGDGVADEGWLRVACGDGAVAAASYYSVQSPRDAASGMASGRRMHKPFKIVAELDRTAGPAGKTVSWDLATMKGGKAGSPKTASYDVKKVEGTGAKTAVTPPYNIKENKGARAAASDDPSTSSGQAKTLAQDDWRQVAVREGSPNLCD